MTKQEVASLVALLKEYYPRDLSNTDIKTRVAAWHFVLADYAYEVGKAAVIAFVTNDAKGFAPSVGQIVEQISRLSTLSEDGDELAAWDKVRKACAGASMSLTSRRIGDTRTSAERLFMQLPEDIRAVVHSPEQLAEWGKLPTDTLNSVIQSHFLRSYRTRREQQREFNKLPEAVKGVAYALTSALETKAIESDTVKMLEKGGVSE